VTRCCHDAALALPDRHIVMRGALMNHLVVRRWMHTVTGLAAALLWGLVETAALARSRWSLRQRS